MAELERERLALLIANDLVMLLAKEPEQAEALQCLAADVERAGALWISACARGTAR